MQDLILLKLTASDIDENGEITIKAITPISTVELTATVEIVEQIYAQLGKRFLTSIESEMENLEEDMNVQDTVYTMP